MNQNQQPRQLSAGEVALLFQFVQSKFVHQKDLQAELVDHLGCSIEEMWQQQPDLSFELALKKVYAGYPITGFAKFVDEKRKALNWYWIIRFWKELKPFFTWPKLLLTIAIFVSVYQGYQLSEFFMDHSTTLLFGIAVLILLAQIARGDFAGWKARKEYLLVSVYMGIWICYFGIGLQVVIQKFFLGHFDPDYTAIHAQSPDKLTYLLPFFAVLDTLVIISGYATLFLFPKILKKEILNYRKI